MRPVNASRVDTVIIGTEMPGADLDGSLHMATPRTHRPAAGARNVELNTRRSVHVLVRSSNHAIQLP